MPNDRPTLTLEKIDHTQRIAVAGPWRLRHLSGSLSAIRKQLAQFGKNPDVQWNLEGVEGLERMPDHRPPDRTNCSLAP